MMSKDEFAKGSVKSEKRGKRGGLKRVKGVVGDRGGGKGVAEKEDERGLAWTGPSPLASKWCSPHNVGSRQVDGCCVRFSLRWRRMKVSHHRIAPLTRLVRSRLCWGSLQGQRWRGRRRPGS